ncbi:unnamed protein product [Parnassius apollo]|uniref:(apollo) hypothetical protein n=1 Tax=Parnassius apollo TaxID=110799 RepID=A0A8S3XEN5_PARAO|nr:unnamed protein product [Parnassius apollo]
MIQTTSRLQTKSRRGRSRCSDHSLSKESTELPANERQQQDNNVCDVCRIRAGIYPHQMAQEKSSFRLQLSQQNSHLLGTLRKNRKGLPKEISKEKLKKGETCVMENNDGVLVLRWKDKRDALALSTRHTPGFVNVRSRRNRNKVTMKPTLIATYNSHKCSTDYSDQMGSYSNPARRSLRWFQKLAIELLFITSLINAFILFKTSKNLTSKKYTITTFKENICRALMGLDKPRRQNNQSCSNGHQFGKSPLVDHRNRIVRRCIHCYEKKREEGLTSIEACKITKKVNIVYLLCPSKPSVCS